MFIYYMVIGQNAQTILEARIGKQYFKISYINARLQNLLSLVFFLTPQTLWMLKVLPYRGTVSAQGGDHSLVVQVPSKEQNVLVWTALGWGIQATHTLCKGFNHEAMSFYYIFKEQV